VLARRGGWCCDVVLTADVSDSVVDPMQTIARLPLALRSLLEFSKKSPGILQEISRNSPTSLQEFFKKSPGYLRGEVSGSSPRNLQEFSKKSPGILREVSESSPRSILGFSENPPGFLQELTGIHLEF